MTDAYPTPPPSPTPSYESDIQYSGDEEIVVAPRWLLPRLLEAVRDEELGTAWAFHSCNRRYCVICTSRALKE